MALISGSASSLHPRPITSYKIHKLKHVIKPIEAAIPGSLKAAALSEGTDRRVSEEEPSTYSGPSTSARMQLDLLEQLTSTAGQGYESDGSSGKPTIREQLANLFGERDDDFTIPLGKNLKKVTPKFLTTSQKRNIRRQSYMDQVSQRNDAVFFATIGAFVILPPVVILGVAIATGYVQLFP
ncbi:uncharacterized protein [Primulina eburnea]|uniref:uncharacterized protein n=1 Tax=Primulina eburnea TaxID=1245227 RepID=UPI003C6C3713